MTSEPRANDLLDIGPAAVDLVRRWLASHDGAAADPAGERLAALLRDPAGPAFALGFVDGVVRPDDVGVAGRNLSALARSVPSFLPWHLRAAVRLGGALAPAAPWIVVPVARRALRSMVGHLVIDASGDRLGSRIAALRAGGARLNLNLLGEAVLGDGEAQRRLDGTRRLLERDDVDYVSIKVSSVAAGLSMWAFDAEVERVVATLLPLYRLAAASPEPKFINLDMEEYRDLDLTLAVFMRVLDQPELAGLEAGVVLQAYLPDALPAMKRLQDWAASRVAAGGASVKVRVVKGANLAMEHVDATLHDWPLATWSSKLETDAAYLRLLDWALTPERTRSVRIGVAGHNLFDIAWTWLLAQRRGVTDRIDFEMLLGMAAGGTGAVARDVGGVILYTPVVDPAEFDVAIAYLVRRLEENASEANFMSAVFELGSSPTAFERERGRFLESLAAVGDKVPETNRVQDRRSEKPRAIHGAEYAGAPDTDPSLAANRAWAARLLRGAPDTSLGDAVLAASRIDDTGILDRVLDTVGRSAVGWAEQGGEERARVLERAAAALAALRADLLEIAAAETGKTLAEGDPEVSEAIDFARYYATLARGLDEIPGVTHTSARVTVVAPPWNFPISIAAGSVLAALASGSGVVFTPAPQARRTGAVLAEALWQAGIPRELLAFVDIDEDGLGRTLISHPLVDRVLLTGSWDTAALFRSWRHDLPLLAETSGKNAIIVTPSADLDLAVADVVRSAFGHAGQKCSAASLVILVGSVGRSKRFLDQLVDATASLRVGSALDPHTTMGPLIEPASGKLLSALTELEAGQHWLVEPRRLDAEGRLWTPGVRDRVAEGSEFHLTEYFGPVLGIMRAPSLERAIELQNAVPYGLTAGLHSLDPLEIADWLETVEAGNLYVNRGITGAIVRRHPFGGWKRSNVGGGAKAGGPNALLDLVDWHPLPLPPGRSIALDGVGSDVARVIEAATADLPYEGFELVRQGARSDEAAWRAEYGVTRDVSALGVERNVFRYRPAAVLLRLTESGSVSELVRVLVAGVRAGADITLSLARPLSPGLAGLLELRGVRTRVEGDERFLERARARELAGGRVRLVGDGGDAAALAAATGGDPDVTVFAGEVTVAGRLELRPFLLEQAVSITAHRFGTPSALAAEVL
ncbi:proline dehydrogenase family protein [Amnibacterium flavum]|uniref:L-glutamate gamma-semialdehyde dehydrogenase n=1 Tax=Amnibacterium flavum TaxID=2173173 RepID=A0A2V1HWG3_9MICO|nr:bifunctional proline dehydrogenase/L-glutamate gamma-semialdehyde dehydrogenase [Amnibacterium flavum]PVZ95529.1 1-pyrroline-5-carboxylate dehydrogenase [Amnibacterium flavum]